MTVEGETVAQRQGSDFPAQSPVASLTRKLRRDSPVRIWLERRKANPTTASGKDLLAILEHPHTEDWKDRLVGFEALGEVELSFEERRQAGRLLSEVLDPIRGRAVCLARLRRAVACLFMIGMIPPIGLMGYIIFQVSFLSLLYHTLAYLERIWRIVHVGAGYSVGLFASALHGFTPHILPSCVLGLMACSSLYVALSIRDRARAVAVWGSALRAMERIGGRTSTSDPVCERALAVLPTLLPRQEQESGSEDSLPPQETCSAELAFSTSPLSHPSIVKWERKLRRNSPIRAWLKRRRENVSESSGAALLTALRDPGASGWADRTIAYRALGEIDLLPAERPGAAQLLLHALAPSPRKRKILSHLETSVLVALPISLVTACVLQPYYHSLPFFPPFCPSFSHAANARGPPLPCSAQVQNILQSIFSNRFTVASPMSPTCCVLRTSGSEVLLPVFGPLMEMPNHV